MRVNSYFLKDAWRKAYADKESAVGVKAVPIRGGRRFLHTKAKLL